MVLPCRSRRSCLNDWGRVSIGWRLSRMAATSTSTAARCIWRACKKECRKRELIWGSPSMAMRVVRFLFLKALGAHGISLVRTPVGDKYVLEEMLRRGATLGGEQSGHIIFSAYATTGDG